jgi:hypothetical protein
VTRRPFNPGGPRVTGPRYLSSTGLLYVRSEAVARELKLTDEQVRTLAAVFEARSAELAALRAQHGPGTAEYNKGLSDLSVLADKKVAEVLQAEQLRRLKQIVLQRLTADGGPLPGTSLLPEYPEVVAALKLTDEQKTKLRDGASLTDTLSTEQHRAWKDLLGEPFAGPARPPLAGALPFGDTLLGLTQDADVAADLKLTPEQSARLQEAADKHQEARAATRRLTGEERSKKMQAADRAADAAVKGLLTEGQRRRAEQVRLRHIEEGPVGLAGLLETAEVADALGLTRTQQDRLKEVVADADRVRELMGGAVLSGPAAPGGVWEKFAAQEAERLRAALTEGQRARLKELLGEPLRRTAHGPGGRGVFGGLSSVPGFAPTPFGRF